MSSASGDDEAVDFGRQIAEVFRAAGWPHVNIVPFVNQAGVDYGLEVGIPRVGDGVALGEAIWGAFERGGVEAIKRTDSYAEVRIDIGRKPLR